MKVVALGRSQLLYDSIRHLYNQGIEIVMIGTSKQSPEYSVGENDFENLSKDIHAKFINDIHINNNDNINLIKELNAEIAISVNWQGLISEDVINLFPHGILNCHFGDLPRYRGNAVANWALLNDESEVVVTIHKMDKELDSGDIVLQERVKISSNTTIGEIYSECEKIVPKMFYHSVIGLVNNKLTPIKQDKNPQNALRCYPRKPTDSFIDWSQSSEQIHKLIRASSEPFSGAYTYLDNLRMYILRAHVEEFEVPSLYIPGQVVWKKDNTGEVGIATKDGVLVIERIRIDNEPITVPTEKIKSLRTRLGMIIDNEIYLMKKKINQLEELIKKLEKDNN